MGDETDFRDWLSRELDRRSWSHNELARRTGISQAQVSSVLKGQRTVTCTFCIQIATALDETPEHVLRLAGILPKLFGDDSTLQELTDAARTLTPEQRQEVLRFIRFLKT